MRLSVSGHFIMTDQTNIAGPVSKPSVVTRLFVVLPPQAPMSKLGNSLVQRVVHATGSSRRHLAPREVFVLHHRGSCREEVGQLDRCIDSGKRTGLHREQ